MRQPTVSSQIIQERQGGKPVADPFTRPCQFSLQIRLHVFRNLKLPSRVCYQSDWNSIVEIPARYLSAIAPGFCRGNVFKHKLVEGADCCAMRSSWWDAWLSPPAARGRPSWATAELRTFLVVERGDLHWYLQEQNHHTCWRKIGRLALPVPITAKAGAVPISGKGKSTRARAFRVNAAIHRRHMRSVKTRKERRALIVGIVLALTFTSAALGAQHEVSPPAQLEIRQASDKTLAGEQEQAPL